MTILGNIGSAVKVARQAQTSVRDFQSVGHQIKAKLNQAKRDPMSFLSDLARGDMFGSGGDINPFDAIHKRGDAVQNWTWYCELPTLNATPLAPASVNLPWYYVPGVSAPLKSINAASINRSGGQRHYAENFSVDDLTLTLFMDDTNAALDYANAWQARVLALGDGRPSSRGMWGLPGQYKKEVKIHITTPDHKNLVTLVYVGCWLSSMTALDLTGDSSAPVALQVTLKVDDMYIEVTESVNEAGFPFLGTTGFNLGSLSFKNLPNLGGLKSAISKFPF